MFWYTSNAHLICFCQYTICVLFQGRKNNLIICRRATKKKTQGRAVLSNPAAEKCLEKKNLLHPTILPQLSIILTFSSLRLLKLFLTSHTLVGISMYLFISISKELWEWVSVRWKQREYPLCPDSKQVLGILFNLASCYYIRSYTPNSFSLNLEHCFQNGPSFQNFRDGQLDSLFQLLTSFQHLSLTYCYHWLKYTYSVWICRNASFQTWAFHLFFNFLADTSVITCWFFTCVKFPKCNQVLSASPT